MHSALFLKPGALQNHQGNSSNTDSWAWRQTPKSLTRGWPQHSLFTRTSQTKAKTSQAGGWSSVPCNGEDQEGTWMPREWGEGNRQGPSMASSRAGPAHSRDPGRETRRTMSKIRKRPFFSAVFLAPLPQGGPLLHSHLWTFFFFFLTSPGMKKERSVKVQKMLVILLIQKTALI